MPDRVAALYDIHGNLPALEAVLRDVRDAGVDLRPADAHLPAGWPLTLRLPIRGLGDVLFCHATPRNDILFTFSHTELT